MNAAGAHAKKVANMAGVALPLDIFRLEMIVTEPLKPFLPVALSAPHIIGYMHQPHGASSPGVRSPKISPLIPD